MLVPARHVLGNLAAGLFSRAGSAGSGLAGSVEQSAAMALRLLIAREAGGSDALHTQIDALVALLQDCRLAAGSRAAAALKRMLARAAELRAQSAIEILEAGWRSLLANAERLVMDLQAAGDLPAAELQRLRGALIRWEIADLQAQAGSAKQAGAASPGALDADSLAAYLRARFADPRLVVSSLRELAGGFGKQTYLFAVQGQSLCGEFVMRRDHADPMFDSDCHRIHKEYALIRAVHAQGFPAPEALWLDVEHRTLPGGDFLVMRRAPGVAGGDVFSASGQVPVNLAQTLARILAGLHRLPPLRELGDLSDSIAGPLWDLPLQQCVRRYLENWLALFQREPHLSSPGIISLFGWLLANVPAVSGSPVLLHGDIGFHNFLFSEERLTAVLDWEFAHLGDPAEDLAYVRNTLGASLDWEGFIAEYRAAGGFTVSEERIRFFQVWGHVRNACAANLAAAKFAEGRVGDLKLLLLPYAYIPQFLAAAQRLIEA